MRCIGDAFAGKYFPPDEERAERQRSWTGPIGSPYPRHELLVAEHAGGVIGFVAVGPARDPDCDSAAVGELRVVLVDARERGAGVGFALIAARERAMRESGLLAATLWVVPENAQAVRCYERCGWSADDTERLGDSDGSEIRWSVTKSADRSAGERCLAGILGWDGVSPVQLAAIMGEVALLTSVRVSLRGERHSGIHPKGKRGPRTRRGLVSESVIGVTVLDLVERRGVGRGELQAPARLGLHPVLHFLDAACGAA